MQQEKAGVNMPRKNSNARERAKPRKLKLRKRTVLVKVDKRRDGMSPGRLVAVAEWR